MKRYLAIALALLMLAVPTLAQSAEPPRAADTNEAAVVDADEQPLIADHEYRGQVVGDAFELFEVIARAAGGEPDIDGAPTSDTAWRALGAYANDYTDVTDGQVLTEDEMAALYADLFAEGSFADIAGEASDQFTAVDGGYRFSAAAGEFAYAVMVSRYDAYEGDVLDVELTVCQLPHDGDWAVFGGNVLAQIVPSPLTRFGARLVSWQPMALPAFDEATATSTLSPQEGNSYDAANVLDGKNETCWAYPLSDGTVTLTLSADRPQTVRGLALTPGYAKSAYAFSSNRRVAEVRVTVNDDTAFTLPLSDLDKQDYAETMLLFFGGDAYTTDALTIEVTGTYEGTHFNDVCISEIVVF